MDKALEDVKILDFSWNIAAPMATKILSNHGAQVIRVESSQRVDMQRHIPPYAGGKRGINRSGPFAEYNDGKYSITIDMNHHRAFEVINRLVTWAEVVVESFTSGTMEKWGLGYEDLKRIKTDIIMVRTNLHGQTGPFAKQPGFGPHIMALCGFTHLIGWPDRSPVGTISPWTDYCAGAVTAMAILGALDYKQKTGNGICIDQSQQEVALSYLLPELLDYTINGSVRYAMGNRHPGAAPHGAYPCCGIDRWCVIGVFADEEWQSLVKVMGEPAWAKDAKFSTLLARKKNEDELDTLIAEWTAKQDAVRLTLSLQQAGVPAGIIANGCDLHEDSQLQHRSHFWKISHPEMGIVACDAPPFRLSKTPAIPGMPAPCLGEHTEYVCTEILGISDLEFLGLFTEGIFK